MNERAEVARRLLLANIGKKVSLRMLQQAGLEFYTARNGVSEAKPELLAMGFRIDHYWHKPSLGEVVADNGYIMTAADSTELQKVI